MALRLVTLLVCVSAVFADQDIYGEFVTGFGLSSTDTNMGGLARDTVLNRTIVGSNAVIANTSPGQFRYGTVLGPTVSTSTSLRRNPVIYALDDNGQVIWQISIPSNNPGAARGAIITDITVGPDSSIYVVGVYTSSAVLGSTTLTRADVFPHAFYAKLDSAGSVIWANTVTGDSNSQINDVLLYNNRLFFCGFFYGNSVSFGTLILSPALNGTTGFIVELNPTTAIAVDGAVGYAISSTTPEINRYSFFQAMAVDTAANLMWVTGGIHISPNSATNWTGLGSVPADNTNNGGPRLNFFLGSLQLAGQLQFTSILQGQSPSESVYTSGAWGTSIAVTSGAKIVGVTVTGTSFIFNSVATALTNGRNSILISSSPSNTMTKRFAVCASSTSLNQIDSLEVTPYGIAFSHITSVTTIGAGQSTCTLAGSSASYLQFVGRHLAVGVVDPASLDVTFSYDLQTSATEPAQYYPARIAYYPESSYAHFVIGDLARGLTSIASLPYTPVTTFFESLVTQVLYCNCGTNGFCSNDGQCTCKAGFTGQNCEIPCPCFSAGGVCQIPTTTCSCFNSYYGTDCSIACPGPIGSPCSNHGACSFDGSSTSCECLPGYTGPDCGIQITPVGATASPTPSPTPTPSFTLEANTTRAPSPTPAPTPTPSLKTATPRPTAGPTPTPSVCPVCPTQQPCESFSPCPSVSSASSAACSIAALILSLLFLM